MVLAHKLLISNAACLYFLPQNLKLPTISYLIYLLYFDISTITYFIILKQPSILVVHTPVKYQNPTAKLLTNPNTVQNYKRYKEATSVELKHVHATKTNN